MHNDDKVNINLLREQLQRAQAELAALRAENELHGKFNHDLHQLKNEQFDAMQSALKDVQLLSAKCENQRKRIVYLEGATNHATGTPLSHMRKRAERAEADLAALRAEIAVQQQTIDGLSGDTYPTKLEMVIRENARLLADKALLDALDRNAILRDRTLAVMERDGETLRWAGVEWDGRETTIRQSLAELMQEGGAK